MENKKLIYFILLTLLAFSLILAIIIVSLESDKKLNVYFLDVGQGDAILIKNGKNQILIDSGRNDKIILEKLGKVMPFWDRKIETLIITHPDADHYGGFDEIIQYYKVEHIIKTSTVSENAEWNDLMEKIKNKNIQELSANWGTQIVFPCGAKLRIIYPWSNDWEGEKDKNDSSIVARLVFGENYFLFTGDLSQEGEKLLLEKNIDIEADYLKIGHHGSKTSTGENFLAKVNPQDAIISVGSGNSYGHPHKEVLNDLNSRTIRVWRTDKDGTIAYSCKSEKDICVAEKFKK